MTGFDDWVVAARAGGGWAFERIWRELAGQVAGYLRSRGVLDVEDATSEVFLAAFKGLASFEGDGAAFRSWLFTIAHRRSVDEYRRALRSAQIVDPDLARGLESAASAESLAIDDFQMIDLLAGLPAAQREVIWLRFVVDLSVEDVARITDRPVTAVKALQRRGVDRLRRHLDGATSQQPISPAALQPIAETR
jgi:RNA polymerase sigma-70 factor (ECF subfamily)